MNAARTAAKSKPKANPRDSWPRWTDAPIPYLPALDAAEAEYKVEVDRFARDRGGLPRLIGREAD